MDYKFTHLNSIKIRKTFFCPDILPFLGSHNICKRQIGTDYSKLKAVQFHFKQVFTPKNPIFFTLFTIYVF